MLEQLSIRNFALIEDASVSFAEAFTVITGETGAGKSIILGALGLLLGEKGDASSVRHGSDEALVAAQFSLSPAHPVADVLAELGLFLDDGTLVIRRTVKSNGRGTIHVQSTPVSRQDLFRISSHLVDIHGQHEHQSLLSSDSQRKVLDAYAGIQHEVATFSHVHASCLALKKDIAEMTQTLEKARLQEDYLRFVQDELAKAAPKPGEDDAIQEELSVLTQYELIHEKLSDVQEALKGGAEGGAVGLLQRAVTDCLKASKADSALKDASLRLETLAIEASDIAETLRDRLAAMSFSEHRLDELQSRLALLQRLKKKYGPTLQDVLRTQQNTADMLGNREQTDHLLKEMEDRLHHLESDRSKMAKVLHDRRVAAATGLQNLIRNQLIPLGMPHVELVVQVQHGEPGPSGADLIEFRFSANPGEPLRQLKDIASGGELSRVMLAIKTVLAQEDDIGTLVFDEVDAGIGGSVALAVGERLAMLAKDHQVLAITHLASIAAQAHQHLKVVKEVSDGRTYTRITIVEGDARVSEIARMLSGDAQGSAAVLHARQLLGNRT